MAKQLQILGILGAVALAIGVFLPALAFKDGPESLWREYPWTAYALLGLSGFSVVLCVAKSTRWLAAAAIAGLVVTIGRLVDILVFTRAVHQGAVSDPDGLGIFAGGTPQVQWLGWSVMLVGGLLILVAGVIRSRSRVETVRQSTLSGG